MPLFLEEIPWQRHCPATTHVPIKDSTRLRVSHMHYVTYLFYRENQAAIDPHLEVTLLPDSDRWRAGYGLIDS